LVYIEQIQPTILTKDHFGEKSERFMDFPSPDDLAHKINQCIEAYEKRHDGLTIIPFNITHERRPVAIDYFCWFNIVKKE
jgi:hypothetical protein